MLCEEPFPVELTYKDDHTDVVYENADFVNERVKTKLSVIKTDGVTKNPVEVCDHFITSRGMGTAIEFALAILARMQDQACADDIAEKIVYKH